MTFDEFMNAARKHDPMIDELYDEIENALGEAIATTSEITFAELPENMWRSIERISEARFFGYSEDASGSPELGAKSMAGVEIEQLGELLARAKILSSGKVLPIQAEESGTLH